MTWVRRTDPIPVHTCTPPMSPTFVTLPAPPPPASGWQGHGPTGPQRVGLPRPAGERNDLWRCDDCGQLWRITEGPAWHPATLWQRFRNRRR